MKRLIDTAVKMRSRARAPYSHFTVGAAVLTDDDQIIGGCNVESSSYGLTCCAERIALFSAVAQGYRKFRALAVATATGGYPCGACRQVIWELCGDIPVYIVGEEGLMATTSAADLLPEAFDDSQLT